MASDRELLWTRRTTLGIASISIASMSGLRQLHNARADSPDAVLEIDDQETDGDVIILATVQTEVNAQLMVVSDEQVDGRNINYQTIDLDAGTDVEDQPLELSERIPDSQKIRAELWEESSDADQPLAWDDAHITVTEEDSNDGQAVDQTPTDPAVELIQADTDAGFYFPYLLYTPSIDDESESDAPETRPLLVRCSPRRGAASEAEPRAESGINDIEGGRGRFLADELQLPTVIALLPSNPDGHSFGNLDHNSLQATEPPLKRLDQQLLGMVADAKERLADEPYEIADRFHMDGFSANGEFAEQFTMLHPERVNAVSSGGNGATTIPSAELDESFPTIDSPETETLPWPVGVADLEELVGDAFNEEAWMDVDQFRYIGAEDQWDPDEYDHPSEYRHAQSYEGWGEERQQLLLDIFGWEQVDERFETSRGIYEALGVPTEFVVYDGVGHEVPEEVLGDIAAFHQQRLEDEFGFPGDEADDAAVDGADDSGGDADDKGSANESLPGFGVPSALAAVGGLGYLLKRRLSETE